MNNFTHNSVSVLQEEMEQFDAQRRRLSSMIRGSPKQLSSDIPTSFKGQTLRQQMQMIYQARKQSQISASINEALEDALQVVKRYSESSSGKIPYNHGYDEVIINIIRLFSF